MARGVLGVEAALCASLLALSLFYGCVGGDDADVGDFKRDGGLAGAETLGGRRCNVHADCDDDGHGGFACRVPDASTGRAVNDVTRTASESRVVPPSNGAVAHSGEDAGADLDAGPTMPRRVLPPPPIGFCSLRCETARCTRANEVCTSREGFCDLGCDELRPECGDGYCDFSSSRKRCFTLDAECVGADDCPVFDERLETRGHVSCEEKRCRYRANAPDLAAPLRSKVALDVSSVLEVQAPEPGERIVAGELESFTFQFTLPADIIVATILTREMKSLEDAASAAVWTAYLDHNDAVQGVSLAQGGAMRDGVWQPYDPIQSPLPQDKQLYFFVLGYEDGECIAQSELVPFSVGPHRIQAGEACPIDGSFCAKDSALLCAEGVCRTPCVSQSDCVAERKSCSRPGRLGAQARLCL